MPIIIAIIIGIIFACKYYFHGSNIWNSKHDANILASYLEELAMHNVNKIKITPQEFKNNTHKV